jgi:hypothetical protein
MNIFKAAILLKSAVKEVSNDYINMQTKVEERVPEGDTEGLHKLLEFTSKEMKGRKVSKPSKVEKGKKHKAVKKSVEDLMDLLSEVGTYKAANPGQSMDARQFMPMIQMLNKPQQAPLVQGDPSSNERMGDELDDLSSDETAETRLVSGGTGEKQMIGE